MAGAAISGDEERRLWRTVAGVAEGELTGNKEADGNAEEDWAMYAGIKAK